MPKSKGRKMRWVPAARNVLRLKVTLKYIRPPIWRRIAIPDNYSLADLHEIIQTVMGWENAHLYAFRVGSHSYSGPSSYFGEDGDAPAETYALLCSLALEQKQKFLYEYDFGDSWLHQIVVEKIEPATKPHPPAVCLGGRRACPPEDCGGVPGYFDLLGALQSPGDPHSAEILEWLGDEFDPDYFDESLIGLRWDR